MSQSEGTSLGVWVAATLLAGSLFGATSFALHLISEGAIHPRLAAKALDAVTKVVKEHDLVQSEHQDHTGGAEDHNLSDFDKIDAHRNPKAPGEEGPSHSTGHANNNHGDEHKDSGHKTEAAGHGNDQDVAHKSAEGHKAETADAHHDASKEHDSPPAAHGSSGQHGTPPEHHASPKGHSEPLKGHSGHHDEHGSSDHHKAKGEHGGHDESHVEHGTGSWAYEGKSGPESWGKLSPTCSSGLLQSPIDIKAAKQAEIPSPIQFTFEDGPVETVYKEKTLVGTSARKNSIVVQGRTYGMVDFRLHAPSEHTIDGERFPLEIAIQYKDELNNTAVVSVLVASGKVNKALQPLLASLPQKNAHGSGQVNFNLAYLVPENMSYFRYDGSLTIPPCSEGIAWHIMKTPIRMSDDQIAMISKRVGRNARPTQALKERYATMNTIGFAH